MKDHSHHTTGESSSDTTPPPRVSAVSAPIATHMSITVPADCSASILVKYMYDDATLQRRVYWWWICACRLGGASAKTTFVYNNEELYRFDIPSNVDAITNEYLTKYLAQFQEEEDHLPDDPPVVGGPSGTKPTVIAGAQRRTSR